MNPAQIATLAIRVADTMTPPGLKIARHYLWLEANSQYRPDASNLWAALRTSPVYADVERWCFADAELAQLEIAVLKHLSITKS